MGGAFYARACAAFPAGDLCLDPATASQCGWGAGGVSCYPCPPGGLCPGGRRVWTQPGCVWPSGRGRGWVERRFWTCCHLFGSMCARV